MQVATFFLAALFLVAQGTYSQPAVTIDDLLLEAQESLDSASAAEMDLLAPRHFEKADQSVRQAREQMKQEGDEALIRITLESAIESLETGREIAASAERKLAPVLKARAEAMQVGAKEAMTMGWVKAERGLRGLTEDLEAGREDELRNLLDPLTADYLTVRRETLRDGVLALAKKSISQAEKNGGDNLFPTLMARARQAMSRAEAHFAREQIDEAAVAAKEAERHAKHCNALLNYYNRELKENTKPESALLSVDDALAESAELLGDSLDLSKGTPAAAEELRDIITERMRQSEAEQDSVSKLMGHSQKGFEESLSEVQTRIADLQNQNLESEQRLRDMEADRNQAISRLRKREMTAQRVQLAQTAFDPGEAVVQQTVEGAVVMHLYGLKFATGQSSLDRDQRSLLRKAMEACAFFDGAQITIEGHTDSEGDEEKNLELSEKRAASVGQLLAKEMGVHQADIVTVGKGEASPIATNDSARGRALNRRIDLVLTLP
ncbi:OmpA family protein [bacterium]|nr:OmpA family protein [bacterium]